MWTDKEINGYTELAQIALTWIQSNNTPDRDEAKANLELLNKIYGQQAIYTGFQVALVLLLRHGAEAAHMDNDTYIAQVRDIFNKMAQNQKENI